MLNTATEEASSKVLTGVMEKLLKRKNEDESDSTPSSKVKFVCKHNPDFIKFRFVNEGSEAERRAQCIEYGVRRANEARKPSKLRQHLETKHPKLVGKQWRIIHGGTGGT